jgi:hypothetical protein
VEAITGGREWVSKVQDSEVSGCNKKKKVHDVD